MSATETGSTSSPPFMPMSFFQLQKFPMPFAQQIEQLDRRKRMKLATDEDGSPETKNEELLMEVEPDIQLDDYDEEEHVSSEKRRQTESGESDSESIEAEDQGKVPSERGEGNDTFTIDEISLSFCRVKTGSISIHCPFCSSVIPHVDVGHHIKNIHKVNRFTCPGISCPNRIEFVDGYTSHIEKYHFKPTCGTCSQILDPKLYPDHLQVCYRQLQSVKATILQPRNSNCETSIVKPSSIIKPKPIELLLGITASDNYQVFLNGKLAIVDGLHFYNRNGVFFLDCNLCAKTMALPFFGSHVLEGHERLSVICPAFYCNKIIESNNIQIKEHNDTCMKTKNVMIEPLAKAFLPGMGPTGIHFLSHFLEDRALKARHQSRFDQKELSMAKPLTGLQLDVDSKTDSVILNNNLQFQKKKPEKNGKIPTVPCPYCGKQCSYLNKHIRDVHQPKVHCRICGKRMGKSYLSEHMKIQHQGKEVPTKVCPLCGTRVQKLKNHLKYSHKMSREDADDVYSKFYPNSGRGQSHNAPAGKLPFQIPEATTTE